MRHAYNYERREGRKDDWVGKVSDGSTVLGTVIGPKAKIAHYRTPALYSNGLILITPSFVVIG